MSETKRVQFRRILGRLAEAGLRQHQLADALGMDPGTLSLILRRRRRYPKGFIKQANEAIDRLVAAEEAADAARRRVLTGVAD